MPVIYKSGPPPFKVHDEDYWIEYRYPKASELRVCLEDAYVDGKPIKGGGNEQVLDPIKYHQGMIRRFAIGWGGFTDEAGQPDPFTVEALDLWLTHADPMALVRQANAISGPARHLREVAEQAGKASASGHSPA